MDWCEDAIRDYHRFVDREVGELIGLAPNGMGVMVIADHGAKKMDDGVYCNEWLIQEGCLALTNDPDRPT